MAAVIYEIIRIYKYLNNDIADPRTQDFFMIGSPWYVLFTIGLYLYFVLNLGPRLMQNRQPFKLDRILQIYNLSQILICAYMFYKGLDLAWLRDYSLYCQPVDYSNSPKAVEVTKVIWMYFIVKIVDLLDTIFFVLRKKQNQVSFLHVYHHTGMVAAGWGCTKYMAGGHATFLGVINLFVHTIMYTYYLLSSLKVNTSRWKKHITQIQMIQFFFIALHFAQLFWVEDCGFPIWTAYLMVPQNVFMLVLFGEFYYKTYLKEKPTDPIKIEANGISADTSNGQKPKEQ